MQVVINGVTADKVQKAMAEIAKAGGSVNGAYFSVPSGVGTVKGYYVLNGAMLKIVITDKPFLLPSGTLETKLRAFFG